MPSPILARADALMRRQRQNDGEPDEIPVLTDALDDDIPVLLDIDEALLAPIDLPPAEEESPFALPAPTAVPVQAEPPITDLAATLEPPTIDQETREAMLRELSERLQRRLSAELPRLIEATLRDYLAERARLADLPPDQRD